MIYVVLLSVALLITLLATYLVIDNNRKKAEQLQKKIFNERISESSEQLKAHLLLLKDARLIRPMDINTIAQIASNFFVVQAKSDETISFLEQTIESFINCSQKELNKAYMTQDKEPIIEAYSLFMKQLPTSGRDFNHEFYQYFPSLTAVLVSPEIALQTPMDDTQTPEKEVTNE